jgi:hypothetical protein
MATRAILSYTTAPSGTGKTYRRCAHFIVTEVLTLPKQKHLSNFPIKFEPWTQGEGEEARPMRGLIEVCEARGLKVSGDEIRERIQLIPDDALTAWRDGEAGPWDTFKDWDLSGTHLAIDEIHNFCGAELKPALRAEWRKWMGEIRHRGARIEFITQHPQKANKIIREECEVQRHLYSGRENYDPYLGISMDDWYQLSAKFTGKYRPCVIEIEKVQRDKSSFKELRRVRFWFESDLFECFDSFSAPVQGGAGGVLAEEPYQIYGWPRFLVWFIGRNSWTLTWRGTALGVFLYLTVGGGTKKLLMNAMNASLMPKAVAAENRSGDLEKLRTANPGAIVFESPGTPAVSTKPGVQNRSAEKFDPEKFARLVAEWRVVGITPRHVSFGNGRCFSIGETLDEGAYSGQRIMGADVAKRDVTIDSSRVRLFAVPDRLREWAYGQASNSGSIVSRPVPTGDDKPRRKTPFATE